MTSGVVGPHWGVTKSNGVAPRDPFEASARALASDGKACEPQRAENVFL